MANIIEAIGLGILGLSTIPLAQDFFPPPYKATTVVRVAAGLSMPQDSTANTGGNTCGIGLFDGDGARIGFKSGTRRGTIGDGRFVDIKVDPLDNNNNRPPEYLSIVAGGSNSLCVAYLAVTPPSSEYWAFYGDIPKQCGAPWYHSNLEVEFQGGSYYPACFWLTSPNIETHVKPHPFPQGYGIHVTDFNNPSQARATQYSNFSDTMCKSDPRYKAYDSITEMNCLPIFNPPLTYGSQVVDPDFNALWTPGTYMCDPHADGTTMPTIQEIRQLEQWTSGKIPEPSYGTKRSERPRTRQLKSRDSPEPQTCADNHVVISNLDQHTATELCQSTTSVGPDFVSTKENLFCDMCTHELWPTCSANVTAACFDVNDNTFRPGTGVSEREESSGREVPQKAYTKVSNW